MHNLRTVMSFEIVRTLKKKSFWLMALGFPLMMAAIFGIVFWSNQSTISAAAELEKQKFSIEVTDDSGLINPAILSAVGAQTIDDPAVGRERATSGKVDAYMYFPADLSKNKVEIYGQDVGIFNNGRYEGVAQSLLTTSVQANVPADTQAVIQGKVAMDVKTFRDGEEFNPFMQMIYPGLFLVLFYMLMAFFGNQMLVSTTEEKENRVIEMLLTTVQARTLIIGKILSMIILAFIQGLIIIIPAILGYLFMRETLGLPIIDLAAIPVDGARIAIGALIFAASFLLYTGLLVAIGAAMPTAKEANGFIGVIMMLLFAPLYAVTLFISAPTSTIVVALSLFPLTAPIPMLLRNAVGNLQSWEVIVSLSILIVSAIVIMAIAVRLFRYGALEYSRKLSLREVFVRKS